MARINGLQLLCVLVSLIVLAQGTQGGHVTTLPALENPSPPPKAVDCQTCKTFMTETKQVFETSVGAEFDIALFGYFCKEDMGTFSDLCKQLVKTYFEKMRELVLLVLAPTALCPALKFCTADGGSFLSGPDDVIDDISLGVPTKCDNCKEFFGEVVKRLKDPEYEQPMVDVLKTVCLAGCETASICIEAANEYGKSLLQVFGTVLQSTELCQKTGTCPPPKELTEDVGKYEDFFDLLKQLQTSYGIQDLNDDPGLSVPGSLKTFPDCDRCRWYMYGYDQYLKTEVGERLISKITTDVCKTDTGIFAGLCQAVVKTFRDYLLQVILDEFKSSRICPLFGFCATPSSNQTGVAPTQPVPVGYKASCEDCKIFFMKQQSAWKDNNTQLKLTIRFRARCVEFCAFRGSCEEFFDVYAPSMMTTVADEAFVPLKACSILKYCPRKILNWDNRKINKEIRPMKATHDKSNSTNPDVCTSCFVTATKTKVALQNTTERAAVDVLAKFCSSLPDLLRIECRSLADRLTPILDQQGPNAFKPGKVCQTLSACNPDDAPKQGPFVKMLIKKQSHGP